MEVEDVTGVGLAPGGTTEEQGHLAVGDGLLGEIVVEDDGVLAVVAEVLADGAAGVRGEELQRGRVGRGGRDDDRVFHAPSSLERLDDWATVERFWPMAT